MSLTLQKLRGYFSARRIILPVVLSLSVVGFMLYQHYTPGLLGTALQASPLWIGIAILMLFTRDYGYMYRLRHIADKTLSWKQSFNIVVLWEFASCVLPSVAGGSTIAAYILHKEGVTLGKSISLVMVTAMLDNFYFVLAVPLIMLFTDAQVLPELIGLSQTARDSLAIAFFISYLLIALYATLMFYALFINPRAVKSLLLRVSNLRLFESWQQGIFRHANELLIASKHLHRKPSGYWVKASISTIFVWTSRYIIIGFVIAAFTQLSLHEHLIIFSHNLIYKVVLFVSVTPGAAGFAELSFPAFFGAFLGGFTTIIILLYRFLTYYLYLIVGAVVFPKWAARTFNRDDNEEEPGVILEEKELKHEALKV